MSLTTSLHTLVYAPGPNFSDRVLRVLEQTFPSSQYATYTKVEEAADALSETAFDLVVLALDEVLDEHAALVECLKSHPTPMPVTVLVHSSDQDRFHEAIPDLSPDWTVTLADQVTDQGLARSIKLAISRHEVRWELEHLQRAFRSSMLQYRNLFDQVPDVIFLCDRSGWLLDVNETATRVFGLPKEKMVLRSIFESFGIDKEVFHQLVRSATDPSRPIQDAEVEYHPPSGQVVHGLMHLIPWQHEAHHPIQFQGVIKDISAHKALEHQLRDSELKYKTLYELGQIASSSLQLEEVAQRSIGLITSSCGALGGVLLLNRRYDELNPLVAENFDLEATQAPENSQPIQIGRGTIGRWAIGGQIRRLDRAEFEQLHPMFRQWLERLDADQLIGCPLGHGNLTIPTCIVLMAFRGNGKDGPDEELLLGLAKTLEMGINNCYHYANAHEAENKYRELWEHAPAYFLSVLKGGVIFEINQTAARALGYKLQEMIGHPFTDFVEPEDRARFTECHRRIVDRGEHQAYEIKLRKKDGSFLIANVNSEPLANPEGVIIGEKSVLYDVTRDKMLEAQLRDHSENLERMVEERTFELTKTMDFLNGILEGSTEYAIFGLDAEGTFVHFNRGAQLIFHYDPEEMVGQRRFDFLTVFDGADEADLSSFLHATERHGVLVRELKVRTGDGREIIMQVSINRLGPSAVGKLTFVGIARDITDQKRLEEFARRTNENLEQMIQEKTRELEQKHIELIQSSKLATLGEMATGIAHELNQPLSGIRTRAQLLAKMVERGKVEPPKILDTQRHIMELVDRISRIIHHMRVFARQDQQPFGPFDVNESVEGCLRLLGEQLRLHAIDVTVDVIDERPLVEGEPSQIEQVLLNLVSNARDAMNEKEEKRRAAGGGEGAEYRKQLTIQLSKPNAEEVCLSIRDNGIGIGEESRKRLFQPFYTTKPVGRGTGLGLSISYGIIASHNGRIEVETRPEEGTTFRIYLPIWKGEQPRLAAGASTSDVVSPGV